MGRTAGLRLATYNIHRAFGTDRDHAPERIVAVLQEMDADIVGLQEVEWRQPSPDSETPLEFLANLRGYTAVTGPNIRDHRGHFGNVLLSRYPVSAARRIDLSEPGVEPRAAIDADLDLPGLRLRVIVTHLGLRIGERRRQARKLSAALAAAPGHPAVLLGDFNDWLPAMPTLRSLTAICAPTPAPRSYPARRPLLALDRILLYGPGNAEVSRHLSPLSRIASDHLPIVGRLQL